MLFTDFKTILSIIYPLPESGFYSKDQERVATGLEEIQTVLKNNLEDSVVTTDLIDYLSEIDRKTKTAFKRIINLQLFTRDAITQ